MLAAHTPTTDVGFPAPSPQGGSDPGDRGVEADGRAAVTRSPGGRPIGRFNRATPSRSGSIRRIGVADLPTPQRDWFGVSSWLKSLDRAAPAMRRPLQIVDTYDGGRTPMPAVYGDPALLRKMVVDVAGAEPVGATAVETPAAAIGVSVRPAGAGRGILLSVRIPTECQPVSSAAIAAMVGVAAAHDGLVHQQESAESYRLSMFLPMGGPAAVAASYARYRCHLRGLKRRPQRLDPSTVAEPGPTGDYKRVDAPEMLSQPEATAGDVRHTYAIDRHPLVEDRVLVGTVRVGAMVPNWIRHSVADHLQHCVGPFDLVLPCGADQFVFALDCPMHRFRTVTSEINARLNRRQPASRLQWETPAVAAVDQRPLSSRLSDLATRLQLNHGRSSTSEMLAVSDSRAAAATVPNRDDAEIVTQRLDAEIRSLGRRMQRQSERMRTSAQRTRLA